MNYKQQLQAYFHQYEKEHPGAAPQTTDVAAWMISEGKWKPRTADMISPAQAFGRGNEAA